MKLVGLMVVRNEEWILRASMTAALKWCDALVVLDHASTDATPAIIEEMRNGAEVYSLRADNGDRWDEMENRQSTLNVGRAMGGTHFAIVDADEIVTSSARQELRSRIARLEPGDVLHTPMIPLWRSLHQYRDDDSVWARARISVAFADDLRMTWKPAGDGYQHHHREPHGARRAVGWLERGHGGVFHAQFANWPRLVAKHLWYAMMETVRYPGRKTAAQLNTQYGQALDERGIRCSQVPPTWWAAWPGEIGVDEAVDLGGDPWQLAAARAMLAEHGEAKFAGLDRRGLVL